MASVERDAPPVDSPLIVGSNGPAHEMLRQLRRRLHVEMIGWRHVPGDDDGWAGTMSMMFALVPLLAPHSEGFGGVTETNPIIHAVPVSTHFLGLHELNDTRRASRLHSLSQTVSP